VIIIQSLDAPKSILETEKTLKTLSSGQIYKKYRKKQTKKWCFFYNPGFCQPWEQGRLKAAYKSRLVSAVLGGYLSLRRLVIQRTRQGCGSVSGSAWIRINLSS
jgi:hypothetical protein